MNTLFRVNLKFVRLALFLASMRLFAAVEWAPVVGDWVVEPQRAFVRLTAEQGISVYPSDKSAILTASSPSSWQFDGAPIWQFDSCAIESRIEQGRLVLIRTDKASQKKETFVCRRADEQKDAAIIALAKPPPASPPPVAPPVPEKSNIPPAAAAPEPFAGTPPQPKYVAPPVYPREFLRAGTPGTVLVDFIVTENGDVANAHAVKSTHRGFETAAVTAVMKWKFKPGQLNGKAVNVHLQVPVVFNLNPGKGAAGGDSAPAK